MYVTEFIITNTIFLTLCIVLSDGYKVNSRFEMKHIWEDERMVENTPYSDILQAFKKAQETDFYYRTQRPVHSFLATSCIEYMVDVLEKNYKRFA